MPDPTAPLIVQTDRTILADTSAPANAEARAAPGRFAELEQPGEDLAGYVEGGRLAIALRTTMRSKKPLPVRPYQEEAVAVFHAGGSVRGGSGVVVLPCGAGKTLVGIGTMAKVQRKTLVLTTSLTAVRQWKSELLDKTDLPPEMLGEYTGEVKDVRPVTITTYQILTYPRSRTEGFVHFDIFPASAWGLVLYASVHL